MVVANNEIYATKNAGKLTTISLTHCPMKHIQGFTQSPWMPPSGKCLSRIAAAAAMFDDFG